MNIAGADYRNNDLIALREDLELIDSLNFRIVPLIDVVERWLRLGIGADERVVALTCDDGSDFDYHDILHPIAGMQRSVLHVLQDFQERHPGSQPNLSITSFVIVSPDARRKLDKTCLIGKGWWNDDWWPDAASTGLMGIANHSWDHNHDTLSGPFPDIKRGTFSSITSDDVANWQIEQACHYLWQKAPNHAARLFAYPYGKANSFLSEDYFPRRADSLDLLAAFDDIPEPLHKSSSKWKLPRFVLGRDWTSTSDLGYLLSQSAAA